MDEKELIFLLKEEPSRGLEYAIRLYGSGVKRIAEKILGAENAEDIEECVSDTFVKLWKNIRQYDPDLGAPLKSYVYGIARYTALTCRRKRSPETDWISLEENDLGIEVDFEEALAVKRNRKVLRETIDAMESPEREIFLFRYYLGYPISEIADRMGLTPKAVESRLYRGRKKLKEALLKGGIIL